LWSLPRQVLPYVLAIDAAATLLIVLTARNAQVDSLDLARFAVLSLGCVVHLEAVRSIERLRAIAAEGVPYTSLKSLWMFAGLLILPLPLAMAIVAVGFTYSWLRIDDQRTAHRAAFNTATYVLALGSAAAIVHTGSAHPGIPRGPAGLALLVAAAGTYWLVNYALVVGAILLSTPQVTAREAMGNPTNQLIVGAGLGLGIAVAVLLVYDPWLVAVLMVTVLALHRGLLLPHFETAARTDNKTGLIDATFWHEMAGKELLRAQRLGTTLGVLMIDLDFFKKINDRYGHLAGDDVLRAVAKALKAEVRKSDIVGRFGGEEFVVLLPGIEEQEINDTAERIRTRVTSLEVSVQILGGASSTAVKGLTASVGAAVFPTNADELDQLLLAADTALFTAKDSGRNQVRMAEAA
jgi:diguanylate cyclase (GGDEF)-like protein